MKKKIMRLCLICLFMALYLGCGQKVSAKGQRVLVPAASGVEVYRSGSAVLDASNKSEGYVMLNYSGSNPKVKFQIKTPAGVTYTYLVANYGTYQAYPLPGGSGNYSFAVYEAADVQRNLYAVALSQSLPVTISNGFQPFLYPNYYVNFNAASACVRKGEALSAGCASDLDVVSSVYGFVTKNIAYDNNKAATVQSGYAPFPDNTLASGKGICFDYASLMAAMLRSQQIPTRLEVGYVGNLYHAWISCYVAEVGWVDGIIQFDGKNWTMMDPTMAAGNGSAGVAKLKKEQGYATKYVY